MLKHEMEKCEKYLSKEHSNNEMLKAIIEILFFTRGEIFSCFPGNGTARRIKK